MLSKLRNRLPAWFLDSLAQQTLEVRNKTRGPLGSNILGDAPELFWYKTFVDHIIDGPDHIIAIVAARHRRSTPEYNMFMGQELGLNSPYRVYLTNEETKVMYKGCIDWFQPHN
jgi:hypothetical protein